MSRKHLLFKGGEQMIDLEQDEISGETVLHLHTCENVIETRTIDKETLFTLLKNHYFSDLQ